MPPPPPNFLPAGARRNRRPLDPTRHLQSRELWNKVRFHATDDSDRNSSASSSSLWPYYKALIHAILYEIQPFRMKPNYNRFITFVREEDGLRHVLTTSANKTIYILGSMQKLCRFLYNLIRPYCTIQSIQQHKHTIGKTILTLIGLKLYHRTLLYLHELLHAGPILIILTLFLLLYTIGLGDNTGASSGVPSAYSVFNRGMRRILGTVDAEELARQYAGGAAAAAMGGGRNNNNGNHRWGGDGGIWVPQDNEVDDDFNGENAEEENRVRNERRRQRRLERLQRRNNNQENDAQDHNSNNDDNVDDEQMNNDDADDTNVQQHDTSAQATAGNTAESNNTGGGRKTGKKARRRNLELRREIQRQRQAAAANGFGRGDGDDDVAMDRLIGGVAD